MREQIYTPGAGLTPPELAGRDRLQDAWTAMLNDVSSRGRAGASDTVVCGVKGVGKSVLLSRFTEIADSAHYEAVRLEGNKDSDLVTALRSAADRRISDTKPFWRKALQRLDRLATLTAGAGGVNVGIGFHDKNPPAPHSGPEELADLLADLATSIGGDSTGRSTGGLVICVDELQAAKPEDIRLIGSTLNQLNTVRDDAPVVFVGAGLPNLAARMIGPHPDRPYITNPERLFTFTELPPNLDPDSAVRAIVRPALTRGVSWHPDAVQMILELSGGYPAHLQAYAAAAWVIGEGSAAVTIHDVHNTADQATAHIRQQYLDPRWTRMTDKQREYITALAVCGGRGGSSEVAAVLGTTLDRLSNRRDALINRGEINDPEHGVVELSMPAMRAYALENYPATYADSPAQLAAPQTMLDNHATWREHRTARQQTLQAFPAELINPSPRQSPQSGRALPPDTRGDDGQGR